ncbi:MAG: hypothetical protein K2M86_03120 [Odoribacter sp.]|nr:hypothetical protein [Odoribacter sp.]
MDWRTCEHLLEKYGRCETTLAEEEELRRWFVQEQEVPLHLRAWRDLFVYQQEERQVRLDEDFDRKILARIRQRKAPVIYRRRRWLGIAAAVLVAVGAGTIALQQERMVRPAEQTPEQALAAVRQALDYVSLKLSRGQRIVEKNMNEMKGITRFIKE